MDTLRLNGLLVLISVLILLSSWSVRAEQKPDLKFELINQSSYFSEPRKPKVLIDNAHNNFHTRTGRFSPFSKLLESDGFIVNDTNSITNKELHEQVDILVIANALSGKDATAKILPAKSAFSVDEVKTIRNWVNNGGSLLLIADHMPYPGAVSNLASQFGYSLYNGFAVYRDNHVGTYNFLREKIDISHPVLDGHSDDMAIGNVFVFSGSAFNPPENALNLLSLPRNFKVRFPKEEWVFSDSTPEIPAFGLSQGAISNFGKGKVAVFAEAAMFTAQISLENGKEIGKVGFNIKEAEDNQKFILNLMRWLEQ